jgi:3-hydroxyisobutyrate dehydrogenase-like beta-hydroxyacid dehydrogenase
MLAGNFDPKGPLVLAIKDLGLSLETGKQLGVMLPMGGLYYQLFLQARYNGWDREDATVVMKLYEQLAGMEKKERTAAKNKRRK